MKAVGLWLCCLLACPSLAAGASPTAIKADAADARLTGAALDTAALKPRLQVKLTSLEQLTKAVDRSALRPLGYHMLEVATEARSRSSKGIEATQLVSFRDIILGWPATEAELAIFAPDREGQARWAVRVRLPLDQVSSLIQELLIDPRLADFFKGAQLQAEGDRFIVLAGGEQVACLESNGEGATTVASHPDLPWPSEFYAGSAGEGEPVLAARLTLESTEQDSGGTFFSQLKLIKSVDYTLRAQENGNWLGELNVNWPPMLGMAAKPFVGRTRQTFFVPNEAFLGAVVNVTSTRMMLDQLVGFEQNQRVLSPHSGDELCVTVLPGTGFLPVPDIVLQTEITDADQLIESATKEIARANRRAVNREQPKHWHQTEVRGHDVFWSTQVITSQTFIPFTLRPVFFVQEAKDGKGRESRFLVIGLTSTNPSEFVERWLDFERDEDSRFLPGKRGLNAEAWVHWQQLYTWLVPYLNLGLSGASAEFVIRDETLSQLDDGQISVKLSYEGLHIVQDGPVPIGLISLPTMLAIGMQEATGSDLARERIASRRLRVLYHHSQLFHQDIGRWPAEVAELDGYIDFAGHPYLLELQGSPKKQWEAFVDDLFDFDDDDGEEDDASTGDDPSDELYAEIDDSLYVVAWQDDRWTLGFEEDRFDHLKQLYIDEDGVIHRIEKVESAETESAASEAAETESGDAESAAKPDEQRDADNEQEAEQEAETEQEADDSGGASDTSDADDESN